MTTDDALLEAMTSGTIEVEGRLRGSSNAALRVTCEADGVGVRAVYKPLRGERPLWDFPQGTLGLREVAASALDAALGWGLVPPTAWLEEGPLGPGSVQAWVESDPERDPVTVAPSSLVPAGWHIVAEGEGNQGDHVCLAHEESPRLRRLCVLDAIMNNADRKGGHVLREPTRGVMGIDHGLTFHVDDKMRTVLWGWAGSEIDAATLADLVDLASRFDDVALGLRDYLSNAEIRSTRRRLHRLVASAAYPEPDGAWPALPWPAM